MWLYIMSSLDDMANLLIELLMSSVGPVVKTHLDALVAGHWSPSSLELCHDQLHVMADSPMELLISSVGPVVKTHLDALVAGHWSPSSLELVIANYM